MNDNRPLFSVSCQTELEARLERLTALRGWKPRALGKLVSDWRRMVSDIANGYENFGIDDYMNELYLRSMLQDLIDNSADECSGELAAALRPIDDDFLSLTVEARWSFGATPAWCNRVPKRPWPDLRDRLIADGLM